PRPPRPAARHRVHRQRQPPPTPQPLRPEALPLPRRPATTAWPVLAVDREGQRQDRQPPTQPNRGRAQPGMDRQRPTPPRPRREMREVAGKATELLLKENARRES